MHLQQSNYRALRRDEDLASVRLAGSDYILRIAFRAWLYNDLNMNEITSGKKPSY